MEHGLSLEPLNNNEKPTLKPQLTVLLVVLLVVKLLDRDSPPPVAYSSYRWDECCRTESCVDGMFDMRSGPSCDFRASWIIRN